MSADESLGIPAVHWLVCNLVHLLWREVWNLTKVNNVGTYDLLILFLGISSRTSLQQKHKDICTRMFTTMLVTLGKHWEQATCP